MSGTLRTAELSRIRRGTHVFELGGSPAYYAESATISLRRYEGQDVRVKGMLEYNTDPQDLPVLVITEVHARDTVMRPWRVPPLNLTLSAPDSWLGRTTGSGIVYSINGIAEPVMTISDGDIAELPEGAPILVDNERGRRVLNPITNEQTVYVEFHSRIITINFVPPSGSDDLFLGQYFSQVLKTIAFERAPRARPGMATSSGSITGQPCGGPAGFLCPAGYYCAVTDTAQNIGACTPIR